MASNPVTSVSFLTPVQDLLPEVEACMLKQAEGHYPDLGVALRHLLSSGGKRVRPVVALLAGRMLGGQTERLVTLAASVELLHTATLVHDDLIDGALLRRGIATLNARWTPAATVLTGDFIFARAAKLAAETDSVPVMRMFAETLATIVSGEITQLFASRGLASREDYEKRIYAKTASMFELAATAAALLSPVGEKEQQAMRAFGYEVGMAFQIVDDVLDFVGDQATVGKPVASDLRQGLITLPALYYLQAVPDDPEMQTLINRGAINDARMDRLVKDIRKSGAIEQAYTEARRYVEQALAILDEMPAGEERQALSDLARYIVQREL